MSISTLSLRSFTVAAALAASAASASALTLPTDALQANSVQAFSQDALDQFDAFAITVTPLGNATATSTAGAFNLPVTSITVNSSLKVTAGTATGSALEIARTLRGAKVGVTIANFKLNFETNQVLADVTPIGGVTIPQMAVYNFNVATPLGLKYKFPLSITGHEVLDQLFLTPDGITAIAKALVLPSFAPALMKQTDFGTITIDVGLGLRLPPVSTTSYTPAP
ncbi:MAG: hypothetical protein KGL57_09385 [Burkholderiales bacterium]|nr:hypothetical protein [Burkholderiales bacterium]